MVSSAGDFLREVRHAASARQDSCNIFVGVFLILPAFWQQYRKP
jgi:hypothetical protein